MRILFLSAIFALFGSVMTASATEEPPHTVIIDDGKFQIRSYEPAIVAEVDVTGDMRRAGNSGFRPLADFIFGNNIARADIEMTAPVTRQAASEKIEMTAPVTRVAASSPAPPIPSPTLTAWCATTTTTRGTGFACPMVPWGRPREHLRRRWTATFRMSAHPPGRPA